MWKGSLRKRSFIDHISSANLIIGGEKLFWIKHQFPHTGFFIKTATACYALASATNTERADSPSLKSTELNEKWKSLSSFKGFASNAVLKQKPYSFKPR